MRRDDIQKLLGGYATGTLTSEEQEALFAAALDDQELFDALAREQSLRDLLRDPAAKAQLLTALDEKPKAGWTSWWRPAAIGLAMTALTVVVVRQIPRTPQVEVAVVKPQAPAAVDQLASAPVPTVEPQPTAKEKEEAPAREKKLRAKKSADTEIRREVDQVAEVGKDKRAAAPPAGIGGVPQAQPATAPPPPPREAAPAVAQPALERADAAARDLAAPQVVAGTGAARARQSARAIFLLRAPVVEAMKSNYVEPAGQQVQGQARQQSPAPPSQQQQFGIGAAGGRIAADSKVLTLPPQPGVRYTVAGGAVRLETNDVGYLYVFARGGAGVWRSVLSGSAEPGQQHVTTVLRPDEKEVFVAFSRAVEFAKAGPVPPQPGEDPSTNLVEKDGETTYVVNPLIGSAGRQVTFTIRLP
jgi:hypothetical protein